MKKSEGFSGVFIVAVILSILLLTGCSTSDYQPPEAVLSILEKSGDNRKNLEEVIEHFSNKKQVIQQEAAFFLISNMEGQGYIEYSLKNENNEILNFSIFNYPTYDDLLKGWDSIAKREGDIRFTPDTFTEDYRVIESSFLIKNIDLACDAWDRFPWCKHVDFESFCEYILPYRGSNEPLENWRKYFYNELRWVADSVKNPSDPVEAAILVNNYIMSWFRFDPRYYKHPTDQGLNEMLSGKMGRCEDMTNLAIYAMRALGIPVMADFTPYWANTGNNHAWNAILGNNDSIIIFMGGEANPGSYTLTNKMAKVYRKTFAIQPGSVAVKLPANETPPPYLDKKNITDVTEQYAKVADVSLNITENIPDSLTFAYLCVFNSGKWKAITGSKIIDGRAEFRKMGTSIAYLPAFYQNKEIIPAGNAFILDTAGKVLRQIPDLKNKTALHLTETTTTAFDHSSETNSMQKLIPGLEYTLYYWNGSWKMHNTLPFKGEKLIFRDVPSGAFYWLQAENTRKEERIFTVNPEGHLSWY
ncbi:MAG: transglutaminase domain-containing protein [Bacteroidales bacterium]|nr:transglutaminase domain-containing protein [Bacteroidales bacterium]